MDLQQLMNPKLIAGVVVVILVIVVAVHCTCENAREQPPNSVTVSVRSMSGRCKHMGPNAERKRNWWIVRNGLKSLISAILIRRNVSGFPASGTRCSLVFSITQRGSHGSR